MEIANFEGSFDVLVSSSASTETAFENEFLALALKKSKSKSRRGRSRNRLMIEIERCIVVEADPQQEIQMRAICYRWSSRVHGS